jgi:hypothetical protein
MTRFKELRRIEQALLHRDVEQLRWAESYCQTRVTLARGSAVRSWQKQLREIREALASATGGQP